MSRTENLVQVKDNFVSDVFFPPIAEKYTSVFIFVIFDTSVVSADQ